MVDGMVRRMRDELGPQTIVVATGGLARLVCRLSVEIDEHRPLLTLEGLRAVHELNTHTPSRSR
jgi:type III pantothenate kinase